MTMGAAWVRSTGVAAACVVAGVLPAIASGSDGGGGHNKPEIQSISYSKAESGATLIEAGIKRASKAGVSVGLADNRERFKLERGPREVGVTFWSVEVPDREDKCAIVVVTAKNRHGFDDRRTRVCTFGATEPDDSGPLPVP
jgi:hypothetical protein